MPNTDLSPRRGRPHRLLLLLLLAALIPTLTARARAQAPDEPVNRIDEATFAEFYEPGVLRIKFSDGVPMRLRDGSPTAINARVDAATMNTLDRLSAGGTWQPLHDVSEDALDALRREGAANTQDPLPDLNNYMRLTLPAGTDEQSALEAFRALSIVEWVGLVPRPEVSSAIPDFSQVGAITGNPAADRYQRYLNAAPEGVDARWAWLGSDSNGSGIRICDLEYDVNENHADLPTIKLLPPAADPVYDDNHGTAVMGIMAARNNGYGVKGIAYNADLYFAATYTINGFSIPSAITRCANALRAGDIIVIEAQATGPNTKPKAEREWASEGLVPVEWDKATYDAVKVAVAAGRIVFEAGANGAEDLDSPAYQNGNGGHHPFLPANDSGAIMVGAGNSPYVDGEDPRAPSWFTNYGATMDVQGWGDGIVTTGYGDLHPGEASEEERNLWFKRSFGGTSGATPIVAASAAILQDTFKAVNGRVATPAEMKTILRSTGTGQQGTQIIGPLPDLRAAILKIYADAGVLPTIAAPVITPGSGTYAMPMEVTIGYGSGQNQSNTQIRYTLNGSEPTEDSFIFIPSQGDTLYLNYGATVTARAFVRDNTLNRTFESPTSSATYVSSTPKVATPVISPGAGSYSQGQQFVITSATPGASIRYRTDGRSISFFYPGTDYTGPITLGPGTHEITARAYKDGYYKSDNASSGEVIVNEIQLPAPTIYPSSGTFTGQLTAYIGSTVLGAEIRYTLDGSEPDENSLRFEEPIVLLPASGSTTFSLKARVFLPPYTPSTTAEAVYTVISSLAPPEISADQPGNSNEATITITHEDPAAVIRYTTNGAEPTSYSTGYSGPFTLTPGQYTVKAKAFRANAQPSASASLDVAVANNTEVIADPTMQPFNTQYFVAPFSLTMRTDTPEAIIRYTSTNDGSIAPDPTAPGQGGAETYTGSLLIDTNGQYRFKIRAYKSNGAGGFNASNVVGSGTLSLGDALGEATVPTIDPAGGVFTDTVDVRLSGAANEVFFYTLDGSAPVSVPPVTPPSLSANPASVISISAPSTLVARAYRIFFAPSATASANFDFICATPALTAGGAATEQVDVTMSTTTSGAQIRYTTDGSDPTELSALYTGPLTLEQTTTLKARCYRPGFSPSEIATEFYVIGPAPETPVVIEDPQGQDTAAGQDLTLSVDARGFVTDTVVFQWQRNGNDIAGENEPTLEIPNAQPENAGVYRVTISDLGGAVTSQEATVTISEAAISGLQIEHNGPTVLGSPTNFAASVATGSGVTFSWDFGDGSTGSGPNPSHSYASVGAYVVTVTAQNGAGSTNAQTTVNVVATAETISGLDAAVDGPTPLGQPTTFFATVEQGTNVTYGWDFGDGTTGSGPRAAHIYATAGSFTVTVTASNSLSSEQRTLQAVVLPPAGTLDNSVYLPLVER